jgi:type III secretion protein S
MPETSTELVLRGLWLAVRLSLPALAGGLAAAALGGLLQNITAWQDGLLTYVPRVFGVVVAYAAAAPWLGEEILAFARLAWGG